MAGLIFELSFAYAEWQTTPWELAPQRARKHSVNPPLGMFWSVAERNIDRPRRRGLRARAFPLSETIGSITPEDGRVLRVPSDGRMIPAAQHIAPPLSPPFDLVDFEYEPQWADGNDVTMPNAQTPKCSEVDLDTPPPQRVCTPCREAEELGALEGKELGDNEFRAQHGFME